MEQLRHVRVVTHVRNTVRELRERAASLRQFATPSTTATFEFADERRVGSQDSERVAERLEFFAAELEGMLAPAALFQDATEALRVLLVERHVPRPFGEALRYQFNIIGVVPGAADAIERLTRLPCDVIVVEERLTGEMSGTQLLRLVASRWPSVWRVLHAHDDVDDVADAVIEHLAAPKDLLMALGRVV